MQWGEVPSEAVRTGLTAKERKVIRLGGKNSRKKSVLKYFNVRIQLRKSV